MSTNNEAVQNILTHRLVSWFDPVVKSGATIYMGGIGQLDEWDKTGYLAAFVGFCAAASSKLFATNPRVKKLGYIVGGVLAAGKGVQVIHHVAAAAIKHHYDKETKTKTQPLRNTIKAQTTRADNFEAENKDLKEKVSSYKKANDTLKRKDTEVNKRIPTPKAAFSKRGKTPGFIGESGARMSRRSQAQTILAQPKSSQLKP